MNKFFTASGFRTGLDVTASIVMILAGLAIVAVGVGATRRSPAPSKKVSSGKVISVPSDPIDISAAATMGRNDAPVTVVEFSDFQCPFCGQFARETMPRIKKELVETGAIRVAFIQLPLGRIHPFAEPAARMAVCSKSKDKFWDVHDAFFRLPRTSEMKDYVAAAVGVGLQKLELGKCSGTLGKAAVNRDLELARKLGVTGTPAFLFATSSGGSMVLGKEWLSGAIPFDKFKDTAERVRAQAQRSR